MTDNDKTAAGTLQPPRTPVLDNKGVARARYPGWTEFRLVDLAAAPGMVGYPAPGTVDGDSWTILDVFESAEVVLLGKTRDDYVAGVCAERDKAIAEAHDARSSMREQERQTSRFQTDLAVAEDRLSVAEAERRALVKERARDKDLLCLFEADFATLRKELGDERLREVVGRAEPPKLEREDGERYSRTDPCDAADLL